MYTYCGSGQLYPYIHAYKNVHKHPVYKSQRNKRQHYCPLLQEEQTYTFCYIHTGILYSSEKEQITVKCSNTIFPSGT